MPIVQGSNTREVIDRSRSGCRTRRADCRGYATARNASKSDAIKEAHAEAKRQKNLAVDEAARDISCPTDGCGSGRICRQRGRWYSGGPAGSKVNTPKKVNGMWEVKSTYYTEKRLNCRCTSVSAVSRKDPKAQDFDDVSEDILFG